MKSKILVCLLAAAVLVLNVFMLLRKENPQADKIKSDTDTVELSETDISKTDISETDIPKENLSDTDIPEISESDTQISETDAEEPPDLNQYAKITEGATLREKATSDSKKLGTVKKGSEVIVMDTKGSWYKITYDGKTGWVYKSCIELIRNRELDAVLYPAIPAPIKGEVQDINGTAVDKYMGEIANDYNATGIQIAIIKNGSVAYTMEYGYANLDSKTAVSADTKFRIASLSKVFTTMNVMKAAEDGKLSLDVDVRKISGRKTRNPNYKYTEITMRMLLTHTSSMDDSDPTYETYPWTQLCRKENYLKTKPGTKFNYCNFGMGYAGACLEKATKMQITAFAQENFLDKMGIDAAYDGTKLDDRSLVATLYSGRVVTREAKKICAAPRFSNPGETYNVGAGGLIISAKDYAALMTVLMNEGQYNGEQYLSKETVDAILTPHINAGSFQQCIGVRLKEDMIDGRTMYYHPGSAYGVYSLMAFDPSDGSGVVVVTSGASGKINNKKLYSVCADIMELCYEEVINL